MNGLNGVNERNREMDLPEVELGIGVATGDVIVGTIGGERRSKYGAIGSAVNLAARIESYTLGGQILIGPETFRQVGDRLDVAETRDIKAKGFDEPIPIRRIVGMDGNPDLALVEEVAAFVAVDPEVPVQVIWLAGKEESDRQARGTEQCDQ